MLEFLACPLGPCKALGQLEMEVLTYPWQMGPELSAWGLHPGDLAIVRKGRKGKQNKNAKR